MQVCAFAQLRVELPLPKNLGGRKGLTKSIVNFECEKQFLECFDALIEGKYDNRSEAIRDGMRRVMRELKEAKQ
jgi:hypothetical protein